jgi:hypothetical protein
MLLMRGDAEDLAEESFRKAIEIAHRQEAKSWELRATSGLSPLLQKKGRKEEDRRLIGEIYNWSAVGSETAELKDAKSLLDSFSQLDAGSRRSAIRRIGSDFPILTGISRRLVTSEGPSQRALILRRLSFSLRVVALTLRSSAALF